MTARGAGKMARVRYNAQYEYDPDHPIWAELAARPGPRELDGSEAGIRAWSLLPECRAILIQLEEELIASQELPGREISPVVLDATMAVLKVIKEYQEEHERWKHNRTLGRV